MSAGAAAPVRPPPMTASGGFTRLCYAVLLATGWRRALAAFVAGACGALAMAPLNALPALFIPFTLAVWLLDGAVEGPVRISGSVLRTSAWIGWCFGFGWFVANLWWLGAAFLVETDEFIWLMPLGVLAFPAALALFHALGFVLAKLLWSASPLRIFALAAGLGAAEWLRGHVLTGFPWNTAGQAFAAFPVTAQAASVFGVEGLTFIAIALFATPALVATGQSAGERWTLPVLALAAATGLAGFGATRLARASAGEEAGVRLRIVQPNLSQRVRSGGGAGAEILAKLLALSDRATGPGASGLADVTHIVWPESPFNFVLSREPQALARIQAAIPPGVTLLTGAVRSEPARPGARSPRYFNALQALVGGVIVESYDKVHLVPFGEYLPFRVVLERLGLRQFVAEPGGFEPGLRRRLLDLPGLPGVLPLICYEAIFPDEASDGSARARLLMNVTNDAWFGLTYGPYQHFAQARMRAVEQGVPMVRAANSGLSAVIDPYGRSARVTRLGTEDVLDSGLPRALPPTVWARHGALVTLGLFLGMVSCSLMGFLRSKV